MATRQVGRQGRSVHGVAADLDCDWHTVNDAVVAYGTALVDDDPDRIGDPAAVGLDETLFVREGPYRSQCWSTQIVDVEHGVLLDVVPGRDAAGSCAWFAGRGDSWCQQIRWATLGLSASYKTVFDTMLPDAVQVADPFHVVRLANSARSGSAGSRTTGSEPCSTPATPTGHSSTRSHPAEIRSARIAISTYRTTG